MGLKFVTLPCPFCGKRSYWESEKEISADEPEKIKAIALKLRDRHEEIHAEKHAVELAWEIEGEVGDA